ELSSIWEDSSDPDLDRRHTTEDLVARARAAATNIIRLDQGEASAPLSDNSRTQGSISRPWTPAFKMPRATSWRPSWRMNVAASVAFVSIAVAALVVFNYSNSTYATGTGQQRTVDLPDGSKVELNARS